MSLRFRHRIRIAPGLHINPGKRGVSFSAGVTGASVNFGANGIFGNVGLPGSGISVRQRLSSARQHSHTQNNQRQLVYVPVQIRLTDDGQVHFEDADCNPLSKQLMKTLKTQREDDVRQWLTRRIEEMNSDFHKCLNLHHGTPPVGSSKWLDIALFSEPAPIAPAPRSIRWWHRILMQSGSIERENSRLLAEHSLAVGDWEKRRADNLHQVEARYSIFEDACRGELASMQAVLEHAMKSIEWPRETTVGFDLEGDSFAVSLDVDLPEVENMP